METISIGQFAKTTGLSIRALRLYDERNILKPIHINPHTGYRSYCPLQIPVGERIRALRDCDVPLEEIRIILADMNNAQTHLERHQAVLKQKLEHTRDMLQQLDQLLKEASWTLEIPS